MNEQCEWFDAPTDWTQAKSPDIQERTFKFAVRVVHAIRSLPDNIATQVVARQLLEAATSVGAIMEEAGETEPERMGIAHEKIRATRYWIRVVRSSIADSAEWIALQRESEELACILTSLSIVQKPHGD
ncbi:MAG: four helix bundle protein [Chloroflexi bacterium]|nr:four helix bundle protein [Chloroflexota bacterium]